MDVKTMSGEQIAELIDIEWQKVSISQNNILVLRKELELRKESKKAEKPNDKNVTP